MSRLDQSSLFSDLDLARRLDRAEGHAGAKFVEARARASPQVGACWIEVAGAYAMYDGPSSPVTQTFGLGLFDPITTAELERIENFFRERGAPVSHDVCPLAGVPLAALLHERGYRPIEHASTMYRPIGSGAGLAHTLNPRIQVRPIGVDEAEVWGRISAKGWSHLTDVQEDFLKELGPLSVEREGTVLLLAELEGQPIAAGAPCLGGGVALLGGACTIPEARQQGAQLALLDYRLRYGAEHGCDIAMICAEPGSASQRNAERHGFRIAYTRTKWQLSR
jgi:hypothetical protein